ncbi:hypothetical protein PR202_ga03844 [Eleusine coracana subsp. coracana]|uniref:Protein kinase domain-containing protein n=1 Tax=Eleusine coracana subsp. coracana TaxID=191504 RepID=A0AAV5BRH0_ELECO|nr:hypothetical protein PR202_ga03844 [Eleusine coracana subsp. coracana]
MVSTLGVAISEIKAEVKRRSIQLEAKKNKSMAAVDTPSSPPLDQKQANIMRQVRQLLSVLGNRWNATLDPCGWRGVDCSSSGSGSSVVTNLTLPGLGISSSGVFAIICPLQTLLSLDLSKNFITNFPNQSFPSPCAMSAGLKQLNLSSNRLSGRLANFSIFPKLEVLDLSFNKFSGKVGTDLISLPELRSLNLSTNTLEGDVPLSASRPLILQELVLSGNQFSGQIPEDLFRYSNLTVLDLSQNNLTGEVHNDFGKLQKLQSLLLSGQITGNISRSLYHLRLGSNMLTGVIPNTIGDALQLTYLELDNNTFEGEIPTQLGNCKNLTLLNLADNYLEGMPASLSTALNLSHNYLNGPIPPNVGFLKELEILDLSYNNLSGQVPSSLTNLRSLTVLVLSYNQFSGHLPIFGSYVSVISNGNPSLMNVTQDNTDSFTSSRRHTAFIILSALSGTLIGLIVLAAVGVYSYSKRIYRVEDEGVPDESIPRIINGHLVTNNRTSAIKFMKTKQDDWQVTRFQDLDYDDVAILQELKEENLIGRGGSGNVYCVTYTNRYNGSTGKVAMKQIRNTRRLDEKLEQVFESETNILGNIRHNNIVKLQCCISSAESMLLVYDYMDNGSLDNWLHGHVLFAVHSMASGQSVTCAPLDWPTRLRVSVGAAQGLYYMHHECSPPIIHRDVKTSNILLDSEFRAKVADFGLARMLVQTGELETMSAVAGSFGYMAPEYAYTKKVNEKVDVYSFGVVLLELTTGKRVNDGGEHGALAQWAWHHYRSGGSIPDATDKCIRYAGYPGEIDTVFRLAVQCTSNSPSSRPTMKDVLRILLRCSQQTDQKTREERAMEHEAARLFLPQRGSRDR